MCHNDDKWYVACPPSVLKKYWAGTGNASKDLMVAATQERGFAVDDHNVSDAIALWHWYAETGGER
jgi:hypothetical protein